MADPTPPDPRQTGHVAPDPHRGEPAPPPQEGMRPEADPSLVRPAEDEAGGPMGGLLKGAGAGAKEEASPGGDPDAEALLAQMGVEEEGIVHGQILGIVIAILASIAALVIVLYFLFYAPLRQQTFETAEDVESPAELVQVRTEALDQLNQYTLIDETSYTVPIGRAMGLVAATYGSGNPAAAADIPSTYQRFNTAPLELNAPRAVQVLVDRGAFTAPVPETGLETDPLDPSGAPRGPEGGEAEPAPEREGTTGEEVGVDEPFDSDDPNDIE